MKQCVHIDSYLDGALAKELRSDFESHIANCPHCQTQADEWQSIKVSLMEWGKGRELPAPGPAKTSELLLALRPTTKKQLWPRYAVLGAVPIAASLALAFFVFFQFSGNDQLSSGSTFEHYKMSVLYSERSEVHLASNTQGDSLTSHEEGSLLVGVGPDRLGLGSQSRVEVLQANSRETAIKLHRGKVAVEVDPQRKNRHFTVLARDIKVKVVGTRFSVTMNKSDSSADVEVAVQRGKVVVEGPGQTNHVVRKGQALVVSPDSTTTIHPIDNEADQLIAQLLSQPENDTMEFTTDEVADSSRSRNGRRHGTRGIANDPEKWRSWILEGKYGLAERAIMTHLRNFPTDTESWTLLATCRRKTKQWRGALNAYQKIVEVGNSKAANTARFEMARILQDRMGNHTAAAEVLSEYLRTPRLLEAEAMVRLGRARLKQGRVKEARQIWSRVIKRFSGTSAAMHAQSLLKTAEDTATEDTL